MNIDEMRDGDIEVGDEREDPIETTEHASEGVLNVDAWDLPDQARSIIARIAVVTGADAEDMVARKDVLKSWAEYVDTILNILNIKWLGISTIDDTRLGKWYLVPISPELGDELTEYFTRLTKSKASGKYLSDEWVISRNRIRSEMISDLIESVVKERIKATPLAGEETTTADAVDTSAVAAIDVASYDFAYRPRFDRDLILSFAEMCGAREDAAADYRFYEDEVYRKENIAQILANKYFPPEENLREHFSNDSVELYEDWYTRAVHWFQEVLPGLLGDVDCFPPYKPPAAGSTAPVEVDPGTFSVPMGPEISDGLVFDYALKVLGWNRSEFDTPDKIDHCRDRLRATIAFAQDRGLLGPTDGENAPDVGGESDDDDIGQEG